MLGKIGIFVQARMSSNRLPAKSLREIGDHPLIYYVVERMKLLKLPVIVCTSTDPSDDILVDYLKSRNYLVYRGSLQNVLDRYLKASEVFGIHNIVRITGDNPLVDIVKLKKSLHLFNTYSYVDGIYPTNGLIKGTGFELVKAQELRKITSEKKKHLEHVTTWLREKMAESDKRIRLAPDRVNFFRDDLFLSCDYLEDLNLLKAIFINFNFRCDIEIPEIISFLDKYPYLKRLNSSLH